MCFMYFMNNFLVRRLPEVSSVFRDVGPPSQFDVMQCISVQSYQLNLFPAPPPQRVASSRRLSAFLLAVQGFFSLGPLGEGRGAPGGGGTFWLVPGTKGTGHFFDQRRNLFFCIFVVSWCRRYPQKVGPPRTPRGWWGKPPSPPPVLKNTLFPLH